MSLTAILASGLFGLLALALAAGFTLKGWHGWLELKKLELASGSPRQDEPTASPAGGRIELADLKERVRKLEAIAAGIDL
ncbi:hypothetical protein GCM10022280_08570 [Sphingomonas swuensis]|uniref:Uncharacterized protein n=2 Tax=Sphingomonas swuensis TaxID=977800 RepID=A0ABP7SK22_9SPHN